MVIKNEDFQNVEEKVKFIEEVCIAKSELYDSIDCLLKPLLGKYDFVFANHVFERENKDFQLRICYSLGPIDKSLNEWKVSPFVTLGHKKVGEIFKKITGWNIEDYGSEPNILLLMFTEVHEFIANNENKYYEPIIINKTQKYIESFRVFPEFCSKFVDLLFSKNLNDYSIFMLEKLNENNVKINVDIYYFNLLIILYLLNSDKLLDNIEIFKNKFKDHALLKLNGITCAKAAELLMEHKNTT